MTRASHARGTCRSRLLRRMGMIAGVAMIGTACDSPGGPGPVASVQVTPRTWSATAVGDTTRFTAIARDAFGLRVLGDRPVTWSSARGSIIFVREDGLAFATGPGLAEVQATIDGVTGTADVSVVQTIESVVIFAFNLRLRALGDSLQLFAAAQDRNQNTVAGTVLSYQSLNPGVATVGPSGSVKAITPGVADIVAMAAGKADTAAVEVLQDVATIALAPDTAVLEDGTTRQFVATLKDHNGYPITGRPPDSWRSTDTLVVAVSGTGLATARAVKLGPAKVIATSGGVLGEASAYVFARFKAVTTGGAKTCAVSERGRSYCWGWIGPSTGEQSLVPLTRTVTPALDSSIGVGVYVACGLTTGGTAYCWGEAPFGPAATGIPGAPTFSSLAVGYVDAYGLTASGDVYTWSTNTPSIASVPSPTLVPGGTSLTSISATFYACGTVSTGTAYCWGSNVFGNLGDSSTVDRAEPTPVAGSHPFARVSVGGGHTCGIVTGGQAYCWGRNNFGAFGDGTITNTNAPVPAAEGLTLTSVAAADWHTCGLVSSGAAYCWGLGERGSVGNGTFEVANLTPVPVSGGLTFVSISAGSQHTCGLTSSRALFCWGRNEDGELGDGTGVNRAVPTRVAGSHP